MSYAVPEQSFRNLMTLRRAAFDDAIGVISVMDTTAMTPRAAIFAYNTNEQTKDVEVIPFGHLDVNKPWLANGELAEEAKAAWDKFKFLIKAAQSTSLLGQQDGCRIQMEDTNIFLYHEPHLHYVLSQPVMLWPPMEPAPLQNTQEFLCR